MSPAEWHAVHHTMSSEDDGVAALGAALPIIQRNINK